MEGNTNVTLEEVKEAMVTLAAPMSSSGHRFQWAFANDLAQDLIDTAQRDIIAHASALVEIDPEISALALVGRLAEEVPSE